VSRCSAGATSAPSNMLVQPDTAINAKIVIKTRISSLSTGYLLISYA
jgi:hypothetical protein